MLSCFILILFSVLLFANYFLSSHNNSNILVLTCLQALDYLHSQDVLFRDLKLENVIINAITNCAVLTDFGLVKRLPLATHRTNTICGTIQYMGLYLDQNILFCLSYGFILFNFIFENELSLIYTWHCQQLRCFITSDMPSAWRPISSRVTQILMRKS